MYSEELLMEIRSRWKEFYPRDKHSGDSKNPKQQQFLENHAATVKSYNEFYINEAKEANFEQIKNMLSMIILKAYRQQHNQS